MLRQTLRDSIRGSLRSKGGVPQLVTRWTPNLTGSAFITVTKQFLPSGTEYEIDVGGNFYRPSSEEGATFSFGAASISNYLWAFRGGSGGENVVEINGVQGYVFKILEPPHTERYSRFSTRFDNTIIDTDFSVYDRTVLFGLKRANNSPTNLVSGQLHYANYIDKNDNNKSIIIDLVVEQEEPPLSWSVINQVDGSVVGSISGLSGDQPSIPALFGGEIDESQNDSKYEAYNSDYSVGDAVNGVNVIGRELTSFSENGVVGSYFGAASTIANGSILVSKRSPSVLRKETTSNSNSIGYSIMLGTDNDILDGFQYPFAYRVLRDDGGTDNTSEYYYYNNGGTYPWNPDLYSSYGSGYSDGYS